MYHAGWTTESMAPMKAKTEIIAQKTNIIYDFQFRLLLSFFMTIL